MRSFFIYLFLIFNFFLTSQYIYQIGKVYGHKKYLLHFYSKNFLVVVGPNLTSLSLKLFWLMGGWHLTCCENVMRICCVRRKTQLNFSNATITTFSQHCLGVKSLLIFTWPPHTQLYCLQFTICQQFAN